MIRLKSAGTFSSAGVLSAIAASLCCITPVIALIAGGSSVAANVAWIEPARPYLIGLSIAVLAFAWFFKIKLAKTNAIDCNCDTKKRVSFIQSKTLLGIVTAFAILMMAFPLYAKVFYPKVQATTITPVHKKQQVKFTIQGMTCAGCVEHVNNELSKVAGILNYKTSYAKRSSFVTFDKSKVDIKTIAAAINKTDFAVKGYELMNRQATAQTINKEKECSSTSKSCCQKEQ